jgi:hypothetical protein
MAQERQGLLAQYGDEVPGQLQEGDPHLSEERVAAAGPFFSFKMGKKKVIYNFLMKEELQTMATKKFDMERLGQVRDIFLFSFFTGLAYADVHKFRRSEISCRGGRGEVDFHLQAKD